MVGQGVDRTHSEDDVEQDVPRARPRAAPAQLVDEVPHLLVAWLREADLGGPRSDLPVDLRVTREPVVGVSNRLQELATDPRRLCSHPSDRANQETNTIKPP